MEEAEFGKAVAAIVVVMAIFVISFQHSNITGAAVSETFGGMYGGYVILFLIMLSLLVIGGHALKR
jgi:hypothetical protein